MKKVPEILDPKEKKTFVETLLIVAGIITVFNTDARSFVVPYLTLFIVASLLYIIRISIIEKPAYRQGKWPYTVKHTLASLVSASFSGIIVLIYLQYMKPMAWWWSIPLLFLYVALFIVLEVVLAAEK
jgi:hypothetical protein